MGAEPVHLWDLFGNDEKYVGGEEICLDKGWYLQERGYMWLLAELILQEQNPL